MPEQPRAAADRTPPGRAADLRCRAGTPRPSRRCPCTARRRGEGGVAARRSRGLGLVPGDRRSERAPRSSRQGSAARAAPGGSSSASGGPASSTWRTPGSRVSCPPTQPSTSCAATAARIASSGGAGVDVHRRRSIAAKSAAVLDEPGQPQEQALVARRLAGDDERPDGRDSAVERADGKPAHAAIECDRVPLLEPRRLGRRRPRRRRGRPPAPAPSRAARPTRSRRAGADARRRRPPSRPRRSRPAQRGAGPPRRPDRARTRPRRRAPAPSPLPPRRAAPGRRGGRAPARRRVALLRRARRRDRRVSASRRVAEAARAAAS